MAPGEEVPSGSALGVALEAVNDGVDELVDE